MGSAADFEVTFKSEEEHDGRTGAGRSEQEEDGGKSLIRAVCDGQQRPSAFRFPSLKLQIRRLRPKSILQSLSSHIGGGGGGTQVQCGGKSDGPEWRTTRTTDITTATEKKVEMMLALLAAIVMATAVAVVSSQSSSAAAELLLRQGPSTTCDGDSKKILCLPPDYSKFDLPYRNDFNIIDIGNLLLSNSSSPSNWTKFASILWKEDNVRYLYFVYHVFLRGVRSTERRERESMLDTVSLLLHLPL